MALHRFGPGNKFGKGRPKGSSYIQVCREWAESEGWSRLISWAKGQSGDGKLSKELQFQAMKMLMEYGYGKPRQQMDIDHGVSNDFARLSGVAIKQMLEAVKD